MKTKYHSWRRLLDMGATLSICEGDRDIGKSFPMRMRAIKRAWKRGKTMLWLRRTEKEYKNVLNTFPNGKWRRACALVGVPFDALRRQGDCIMVKRKNGEEVRAIRFAALSDHAALRDADDPSLELVFIDEAFPTIERFRAYRGGEVADAMDILKSMRRDGLPVRMLICGNRESACAPWYDYFKIRRPTFDEGFCYLYPPSGERIAYERARQHAGDEGFLRLVSETTYGAFMRGEAKGINSALLAAVTAGAAHYANVRFKGVFMSVWRQRDGMFIISDIKHGGRVLTDELSGQGAEVAYTADIRKQFALLRQAYKAGKVRFSCREVYAAGQYALAKLV